MNDLTYILQITGFVMGVAVRADALEDAARPAGACPRQSRQDELRHARHRLDPAPRQHLKFLENMDQPLLLLDGPAYRDAVQRTLEEERALLRRLNLLPG